METFNYPPVVEILEKLIEGSLKQDLPKAVRLWVILRSLYGDELDDPVRLPLKNTFTFNEWQNQFFNHKKSQMGDSQPANCNHTKTISQWLFDKTFEEPETLWRETFKKRYDISDKDLDDLIFHGKPPIKNGQPHKYSLPQGRLFGVTIRNLQTDFKYLVNREFLSKNNREYSKVTSLPELTPYQTELPQLDLTNLAPYNLSCLIEKFNQKINGENRFYLEIEDIIPGKIGDKVEELQDKLARAWQQKPVPPILLTYRSAKLFQDRVELIVYPVCLYYYRRAPYLIAYGQFPGDETKIDWYDYRIDHITSLKILDWNDINLPELRLKCSSKNPPNLEQVRELMNQALGFEFYQEAVDMFLWFDPYFYANYIEGTERDALFQKTSAIRLQNILNRDKTITSAQKQHLLSRINRSPTAIYYRLKYRKNDNNVVMRLRAWGPNVEVILPYELRERMAQDIAKTWQLYN